jgi:hypothetical protein
MEMVQAQARELRHPPRIFEEVLGALHRIVPEFVEALRRGQQAHDDPDELAPRLVQRGPLTDR